MKITYDWLKDHLKVSAKEDKLLEKLTDIGLEVESIENLSEGLDSVSYTHLTLPTICSV